MFESEPRFRSAVARPRVPPLVFSDKDLERSITERFETVVAAFPDRIAVESVDESYTFRQMDATANRLAREILRRSDTEDRPVALMLEHGAAAVVAIFACLKTGRCYVMVDPSYPIGRITAMLSDSGARTIISGTGQKDLWAALDDGSTQIIDFNTDDPAGDSPPPDVATKPESTAMLIYTSGSTGSPKGVMHSHANVLADSRNLTDLWRITHHDRFLLYTSLSFANSVRTIYASLLNGASVYPFDLKKYGFDALARWLIDKKITVFRCVPTMFRQFAASIEDGAAFPDVRIFSIGGETVKPGDVALFNRCFGSNCVFVTAFGPTECLTVCCCFLEHGAEPPADRVPIGYPMRDKAVLIFDESGAEVMDDSVGEIAVRSRFITNGYWQNPEADSKVLSIDPARPAERIYRTGDLGRRDENGCLWHIGRKDFQVKVRGFRIETQEIEEVISALPGVADALVTAVEGGPTGIRLTAYFVANDRASVDAARMRQALGARLPEHMIPSVFVPMEAFPVLPNGKTDRKALPMPSACGPDVDTQYTAPRTQTETRIVRIWQDILGVEQVGIDDPFLALGGDSLSALRVASRISEAFGIRLTLGDILLTETVRQIGLLVGQRANIEPATVGSPAP